MSSNKGLGRGLEALIPKKIDFNSDNLIQGESVREINLADIIANPDQPRQQFDELTIIELAQSIKENGLIQPIIVTKSAQKFIIIAGERRWRAAKIAGLSKIACIVRSMDELQKLEVSLIENVQREDLTSIEQAISIQRLHEQFSQSYDQIANRLGKAKTTIDNMVRLLKLPDYIKDQVLSRNISEGHARCLVALNQHQSIQEELYNLVTQKHISVRQAEQFVAHHKKNINNQKEHNVSEVVADTLHKVDELAHKLSEKFKLPVISQPLSKGGKLVIKYKNDQELDALVEILGIDA